MPRENLCVQVGNHHTLSYTCTTTVDHKDQIWVAAMKRQCSVHYTTWTPFFYYHIIIHVLVFTDFNVSDFLLQKWDDSLLF